MEKPGTAAPATAAPGVAKAAGPVASAQPAASAAAAASQPVHEKVGTVVRNRFRDAPPPVPPNKPVVPPKKELFMAGTVKRGDSVQAAQEPAAAATGAKQATQEDPTKKWTK